MMGTDWYIQIYHFTIYFRFHLNRAALGRVCLKLVVVMGVFWVTEVISWIHENYFGGKYFIWMFPDLINALHGVFIFIVVGCQPQVTHSFTHFFIFYFNANATTTTTKKMSNETKLIIESSLTP